MRSVVCADGNTPSDAVVVRARGVMPAPIGVLRGDRYESSIPPPVAVRGMARSIYVACRHSSTDSRRDGPVASVGACSRSR